MKLIPRALARAFAGSLAIGVGSRLLALAMAVLVARQLEPAGYGVFNYALGMGVLTGQAATLGLPILQTRLIPKLLLHEEWSQLRGLLAATFWLVSGASLIVSGGLAVAGVWGGLGADLKAGLLLSAVITPVVALRVLRRQQLIALGRPQEALAVDEILPPFAACCGALLLGYEGAGGPVAAIVLASIVGVMLGTWRLTRGLPLASRSAVARWSFGAWMRDALSIHVGFMARQMLNRVDVLMLTPLAGAAATGLYSAAFRITYLLTFVPVILNTVLSREFSAAYAASDNARLRRTYKAGLIIATGAILPMAVGLMFGAEDILRQLFGAEYASAASILVILVVSQSLQALSIVSNALLIMTGRSNAFAAINGFSLGANLCANMLFIPLYGAIGAAFVSVAIASASLIAQSIFVVRSKIF